MNCETYTATIEIAGDFAHIRQLCRAYCYEKGECVSLVAAEYPYKGGLESGAKVGLINYPRFPREPAEIWDRAVELGTILRDALCQHSFTIVATDKTEFFSRREA